MILIERDSWAINIGWFYISFTWGNKKYAIDSMLGVMIVRLEKHE